MKLMVIFNDIYIEGKDTRLASRQVRGSGYQVIRGRNLNAW
jgi:hypothetical protein